MQSEPMKEFLSLLKLQRNSSWVLGSMNQLMRVKEFCVIDGVVFSLCLLNNTFKFNQRKGINFTEIL